MKKLIRTFALFALLALGLTFASCSFNVDTSGAVAVYQGRTSAEYWFTHMTVIFYPDGEYKTFMWGKDDTIGTYVLDGTFNKGSVVLTEMREYKNGRWYDHPDTIKCKIAGGALSNTYGRFPRTK